MKHNSNIYFNPRFFDMMYKIKEECKDFIPAEVRDVFSGNLAILFAWPGDNGRLFVKVADNKGNHLTTEFENLSLAG